MQQTITQFIAILVIIITVYLLIKRYETRMVLIGAGLLLCIISFEPLQAFDAFSKQMANGTLLQAICSSMGFAFVMKYTKCDTALVSVLTKPLARLGFLLIPITVIITAFINTAIISAAGCAAAVGATLIPLLISNRIHPAIAGGAVLCGTFGSFLNPGMLHNVNVAKMVPDMSEMELVIKISPFVGIAIIIGAIMLSVIALLKKEYNVKTDESLQAAEEESKHRHHTWQQYVFATAPFVPLILLLGSNLNWFGETIFNVPTAMLIGSLYALCITLSNPSNITKEFFKGMGTSYADIIGIIIAAGVFAQGLQSSGVISAFINFLTHNPEFARWGGTIGPFLMGIITGSGDAAALAFNHAVTPYAETFGYTIDKLGAASSLSGALGRTMSPVAGVVIVCAGLAKVAPMELAKRTAPGMIIAILFIALFML